MCMQYNHVINQRNNACIDKTTARTSARTLSVDTAIYNEHTIRKKMANTLRTPESQSHLVIRGCELDGRTRAREDKGHAVDAPTGQGLTDGR